MKLTSKWTQGQIFWRTFTKDDTVYIIGLRQGFLSYGESTNYDNPSGFFQMEIKRNDGFGPFLISPGRVISNSEELILTDDGQLAEEVELAIVTVDSPFKFEYFGSIVQFFSTGSADSVIEINSTLTQVTTSNNEHKTSITSSAATENGATLGGEVHADGEYSGIKYGVKVNGSISSKVTNKIEQAVATTMGIQITTTTTYNEKQNVTLKAGKFTVIKSSWQRRFVTGGVTIGSDHFSYDATLGYLTSRQIAEYASVDDLPSDLMALYREQTGQSIKVQSDWRWCHKCQGLFFSGGQSTVGTCPAGGQHEKTISGDYTLTHNSPGFHGPRD